MLSDEIWWPIGLFVAILVAAALVNRIRPTERRRVRRLAITYALHVVTLGVAVAFEAIGFHGWASTMRVAAELLQAYVIVMLAATLVFTVILPGVRAPMPLIASDLIVGLGIAAATLVVLSKNGMNPTNALVSGAVVSAVLAISLQSTLGNILGGVALQLDGSVQEGDWIQFDAARVARVRAVRWRHTVVETRDATTMIVPNAQLLAQSIVILARADGSMPAPRLGVPFNVDQRHAPSHVVRVVEEALAAAPIPNVLATPPPAVACLDLSRVEAFLGYIVRYSIADLALEEATSSLVRARVYAVLRREGIPLSLPAALAFAERADDAAARLAALKAVSLFQTFSPDELATLAGGLRPAAFVAGERIFKQGTAAKSLYILATGQVEVRTNVDPDGPEGAAPEVPVRVAAIDAPSYFGERGLVTGEPRAADAFAITDVTCYRLDKETFQTVLLARPAIASEISERITRRNVELEAARAGVDADALAGTHEGEHERLRRAIQGFFGL